MNIATVELRAVCGNRPIRTVTLKGVKNIQHAKIVANGLVGSFSIAHSLALYVAEIHLGDHFVINAAPEYISEGVEII